MAALNVIYVGGYASVLALIAVIETERRIRTGKPSPSDVWGGFIWLAILWPVFFMIAVLSFALLLLATWGKSMDGTGDS